MDRPHSLMLNKDRNSDVQKYFEEKGFTIKIGEESSVAFIKRSSGETIDVAGGDKMFDMTMMVTDLKKKIEQMKTLRSNKVYSCC